MRKTIFSLFLTFCATFLFAALPTKMYVAVQDAELKESASSFAKTTCTIEYGDQVAIVSDNGKWAQVQLSSDSSKKGWIPVSSLSKRRIIVGKTSSASAGEIALAGKGFNADVEDVYSNSGNADYDAVNEVEKNTVSGPELESFLKSGALNGAK